MIAILLKTPIDYSICTISYQVKKKKLSPWPLVSMSHFVIPIFSQLNGRNLWYCKLCLFDPVGYGSKRAKKKSTTSGFKDLKVVKLTYEKSNQILASP